MFITDHLTPAETLSELLATKGYAAEDTARFRRLRHNDHLCPAYRERVSALLDAYKSHRTDVHDVQGLRDDGVDVLLSYEDEGIHRVGLQIKSFKEIDDWAKGRDHGFIMRLKAQCLSATSTVRVGAYYLMLCTDEIEHREQIRTICSELKMVDSIKIVRPRQALAFLDMREEEIQARMTRLLCSRDGVLETALDDVSDMKDGEVHLMIALMCTAFGGRTRLDSDEMSDLHQDWLNRRRTGARGTDDLEEIAWGLEGRGLSNTDNGFEIDVSRFPTAICAMYFDQKHRSGGDTKLALYTLLCVAAPSGARIVRHD